MNLFLGFFAKIKIESPEYEKYFCQFDGIHSLLFLILLLFYSIIPAGNPPLAIR